MAVPFERPVSNPGQAITAAQVDHLPIIAHYARRLGLVDMNNGLVPLEMDVKILECPRFGRGRPKQGVARRPIAIAY